MKLPRPYIYPRSALTKSVERPRLRAVYDAILFTLGFNVALAAVFAGLVALLALVMS